MLYESTRGYYNQIPAAEAIKMGIAPNGGLFVPGEIPLIPTETLQEMTGLSYQDRAAIILRKYLTDYNAGEIAQCVSLAYNRDSFDIPDIAHVHQLTDSLSVLELWHGPTCAFKDMALQILPHILTKAAVKTGDQSTIVILVATSGDTGKAALEGFKNVPQTRIIVFYPQEGVSNMQKLQMVTQEGANVHVVAVQGNFDDAQNGVKNIFGNAAFGKEIAGKGYRLSSANSINWGRLVPQIIYYFSAYLDLLAQGRLVLGEKVNFVVPTGNFGNILSAYYAAEMGLPVNRLICASNANNVLTDFIRTGGYDSDRRFRRTISPSMDILISSNLERLLYHLNGRDAGRVEAWMAALKDSSQYRVDEQTMAGLNKLFWSGFADDSATMQTILKTYREFHYLVDPHTGVGLNVYGQYLQATADSTKTIVASTASPFKFGSSVAQAIFDGKAVQDKKETDLLEMLSEFSGMKIPVGLRDLNQKPVVHSRTVAKGCLLAEVEDIINHHSDLP